MGRDYSRCVRREKAGVIDVCGKPGMMPAMDGGDDGYRLGRRDFLEAIALAAGGAAAGCSRGTGDEAHRGDGEPTPDPAQWWVAGRYVRHATVDAERLGEGIVRARVDGAWRDFAVRELPPGFVRWSLGERMARLEKLATEGFDPRDLDGPHNACVATCGGWSRDSAFSLNTAYKGMGFAPRPKRLAETLETLDETAARIDRDVGADFPRALAQKTRVLAELYANEALWDRRLQVSLELFTSPTRATHTFLNMMANPIASASFLAYPTFEIRAIPRLLHGDDPDLDGTERQLVRWTNAVHDFVHGGDGDRLACVYYVIELFDDTPSDGAAGRRIV